MDDGTLDVPLFKAVKRRKVVRRRAPVSSGEDAPAHPHPEPTASNGTDTDLIAAEREGESDSKNDLAIELSVPRSMLNHARRNRARGGGIAFTTSNGAEAGGRASMESDGLVLVNRDEGAVEASKNRFAPQTGQVVDPNDRHMMAYVDAEIARMRGITHSTMQTAFGQRRDGSRKEDEVTVLKPAPISASQGKIQEIDLGPDAAARNIARTQEATRRLHGDTLEGAESGSAANGLSAIRNAKLARKKRGRRTSDDVRRDELVDSILRENKLDLYDDHANTESATTEFDEATDERIAEQFKQEFMDAVQTRNRELANRKPPASGPAGRNAAQAAEPKGPKLGGSRNARAAMRAREIAAQQRGGGK